MDRADVKIGEQLTNQQITQLFGVGNMGGMRRSIVNNLLVLISDHTKGLYRDRWQGDVLLYTGMGKIGDQKLDAQNRTVAESQTNGVTMHLFESAAPKIYRYSGIVELADRPFHETQLDEKGKPRSVWIFPLRRTGAPSPIFELVEPTLEAAGEFDPQNIVDARERVVASIVRRRGQWVFRNKLLVAYGNSCPLSGCRIPELLDAAHIIPYKGIETNDVRNGILLRTDLHTLFDLGMLTVDPGSWTVVVSKRLNTSTYSKLSGKRFRLPKNVHERPSVEALKLHRSSSGL